MNSYYNSVIYCEQEEEDKKESEQLKEEKRKQRELEEQKRKEREEKKKERENPKNIKKKVLEGNVAVFEDLDIYSSDPEKNKKINDELKSFLQSIGCKPARIKIKNGSAYNSL